MKIQNVVNKYRIEDHYISHPNIDYVEIEGIKLRDSLFIVYPQDSSYTGSEFYYSLKPLEGTEEIIFDYNEDKNCCFENCGVFKIEDQRVLNITYMNNWHFNGYIFQDENSWKQFSDLSK